jgi:hypothetical protein
MAVTKSPTTAVLRVLALLMVVVMSVGASSCVRVSRERTLPPSIRSVSVPMIINRTAEVGLEEDATLYLQKEFMADGRLKLVGEGQSDAIILVTLKRYRERNVDIGDGGFPRQVEVELVADVFVVRNEVGRPRIGPNRQVSSKSIGRVDTRRNTYETQAQRMERLYHVFARQVVQEVLTGDMAMPEYLEERQKQEEEKLDEGPPSLL